MDERLKLASRSGTHRVEAAVDVHDLAGGGREEVGEQGARRPARSASWSVSSQPSGARSFHIDSRSSKPGIALAASVLSGPAETRLTRILGAEVAGEVARGRLEAGLGHAHPVVRRPRDRRVEGQPDDRAARATSAAGRPSASDFREYAETWTACATSGHGPVEELAAEQRLGVAVGDRVHHAVEAVDVLADLVGEPGEVVVVGHVELEHRRLGRAAAWRSAG